MKTTRYALAALIAVAATSMAAVGATASPSQQAPDKNIVQTASAQSLTISRTRSGRASVVRSRSLPARPRKTSRTEPPTRASVCGDQGGIKLPGQ